MSLYARRSSLPLYPPPFWLEAQSRVLRQDHETICTPFSRYPTPVHPPLHGRLPDRRLIHASPGRSLQNTARPAGIVWPLRQAWKRFLGWGQRIDPFGFTIDPEDDLRDHASATKTSFRRFATTPKGSPQRCHVYTQLLRHFCGVAVSCSLAMPLARFYTRSFNASLKNQPRKRVRLVHVALSDLRQWQKLRDLSPKRLIQSPNPLLTLNSDASSGTGQGEALGYNLQAGAPGVREAPGVWEPLYQLKSIHFLELCAITGTLRAFAEHLHRYQGALV